MAKTIEGRLRGDGLRVAIVASRFNELVVERLLHAALDTFKRHGTDDEAITVVRVPGAFEMPVVAKRLAESGNHDVVVCLGAVVRGATAHFDFVAGQAASGLQSVAVASGVPVAFGVMTTETVEQAIERAGMKAGNIGHDAAVTAIEMANVLRQL